MSQNWLKTLPEKVLVVLAKTDLKSDSGGSFLTSHVTADQVFTREDLSPAQQMFGRIAQDFMRTEVLPPEQQIYEKDWRLTRELLLKAGALDLLRVDEARPARLPLSR